MSGKSGIRRLRGRVAGLVAGSLLVMSMAGTASASVGAAVVTSGPTPGAIPLGASSSYNVWVVNSPDSLSDALVNHAFSVTAVSGAAGLTVSSPCLSIGWRQAFIGTLTGVVVQTDPATTPLGTSNITLTVTEFTSATSCSGGIVGTRGANTHITVNPGTQTITFAAIANRTYGAPTFALGATASSGLAVSYATSGPCSESGGNLTITGIGSCSVTASQTGDARWLPATPVTRSFNIAPAVLTVKPNAKNRPYGSDNPTLTVDFHGFQYGESYPVLSGNADIGTTALPASPVGAYPITATIGTLSAANYTFAFEPGTLTVEPAGLTVTASNASKTQGDPNPALSATVTGFVLGETDAIMTSIPACTTSAVDSSPIGTYPITCTDGAAPNYAIVGNVPGTLSVVAGPLDHIVISPDDATTTAGVPVTYSAEGFDVNGNTRGDVTASTGFTVAGGTCAGAACRAGAIGDHTVTGSIGAISDTAVMHVTGAGAPDHVVISPNGASITAGTTQAFTAQLFDGSGNPLGDVTAQTTFSIDGGGTCTGADCGAANLGDYNVTAVTNLAGALAFRSSAVLHVTEQVQDITSPPTGTTGGGPADGGSLAYLLLIAFAMGSLGVLAADMQRRAGMTQR